MLYSSKMYMLYSSEMYMLYSSEMHINNVMTKKGDVSYSDVKLNVNPSQHFKVYPNLTKSEPFSRFLHFHCLYMYINSVLQDI